MSMIMQMIKFKYNSKERIGKFSGFFNSKDKIYFKCLHLNNLGDKYYNSYILTQEVLDTLEVIGASR